MTKFLKIYYAKSKLIFDTYRRSKQNDSYERTALLLKPAPLACGRSGVPVSVACLVIRPQFSVIVKIYE